MTKNDFDEIFESCPTVIYRSTFDNISTFYYLSNDIEFLLGYSASSLVSQYGKWNELIHPHDQMRMEQQLKEWIDSGSQDTLERQYRIKHQQGHYLWLSDKARLLKADDDEQKHYIGTLSDITELVTLSANFQTLSRVSPGVIFQYEVKPDGSSRFPYASDRLKDIYDVTPEEAAIDATPVLDAIHPEDIDYIARTIADSAKHLTDWACEYRVFIKGEIHWLYGHSIPERALNGSTIWSGTIIDITDRKNLELKLLKESTTDPLTELYNRRYFMEIFEKELNRSIRDKSNLSVLAIDFDFFKQINDNHGHTAGDKVLVECSTLMSSQLRNYDTIARFGGEEFIVLLPKTNYEEALAIGEKLRSIVEKFQINYDGKTFPVTITVGAASTNGDNKDISEILSMADTALFAGKNMGRNCVKGIR